MRKILIRSLVFCSLLLVTTGAFVGWRALGVYRTTHGGFQHLRYLLESGETLEGTPADDVLSDSYLLSLFGENPELVDRLKAVIDLGMATDANLKLGQVSAMVVTYNKDDSGAVLNPAIYAVGGFPDPQSRRLGFHSTGYMSQEIDRSLWLSGNAVMNLLGRDIIVFCEQDKAEEHMALLYDLLQGNILPLAQRIVGPPLHYAIVFPDPKELAPPNLRNNLQTVIIKGEMGGDYGKTETIFVTPNQRAATQSYVIFKDMVALARMVFHDQFSGYIKDMPWGKMNDTWWAVEYVELIDDMALVQDQVLIVARMEYDRVKNNALLKTVERIGRDIAMQKSYLLAGELPWEFAYRNKESPSGGYWSAPHRWGPEWPLGRQGIPTANSMAASGERERLSTGPTTPPSAATPETPSPPPSASEPTI